MTTNAANGIAKAIHEVDGNNRMAPDEVGYAVAGYLIVTNRLKDLRVADIVEFVERTNPDKRLGAGALAELIVAEFGLDEVTR